mmetsp:Transcript_32179/g.108342  ORF Transcript_32179/g.108342 Transcript_32179/m.108342 type:complete len:236 (+) Transcript_32179:464-1171(+)
MLLRAAGVTMPKSSPVRDSNQEMPSSKRPMPGAKGATSTLKGDFKPATRASTGATPCDTAKAAPTMCRIWCSTNAAPETRTTRYAVSETVISRCTRHVMTLRKDVAFLNCGSSARGHSSPSLVVSTFAASSASRKPEAKLWNLKEPSNVLRASSNLLITPARASATSKSDSPSCGAWPSAETGRRYSYVREEASVRAQKRLPTRVAEKILMLGGSLKFTRSSADADICQASSWSS